MTPVEILKAAKAKIEDPAHWCQGNAAWDLNGRACVPEDHNARSWCSWGAVTAASRQRGVSAHDYLDRAADEFGFASAVVLNDSTDHPTVMKMFDRAIALAEQEAK